MGRCVNGPTKRIISWKLGRMDKAWEPLVPKGVFKRVQAVISINEKVDHSPAGRMLGGITETVDEFYVVAQ